MSGGFVLRMIPFGLHRDWEKSIHPYNKITLFTITNHYDENINNDKVKISLKNYVIRTESRIRSKSNLANKLKLRRQPNLNCT